MALDFRALNEKQCNLAILFKVFLINAFQNCG